MTSAGVQPDVRHRFSLRLKLTFWIVVVASVVQLTLMGIAALHLRHTLAEFFDDRLRSRALVMAEAVRLADCHVSDEELARFAQDSPRFAVVEKLALTLYDESGAVVASNLHPAPPPDDVGALNPPAQTMNRVFRAKVPGLSSDGDDFPARVVLHRIRAPDGHECVLMIAATDTAFQGMMTVAVRIILITLPVGALASAIAGWMIGGLAIAPLERLRRLTVSLSPESLQEPSIERGGGSREAAELEKALAETRSKLQLAFQAQDRFIANVSHELKTPIAVVLTEADTIPQAELSSRARVFVESTVEEMNRLGTIVESFLTLTKLKGGAALPHLRPADINAVVLEAIVECRKLAQQHRVDLMPELAETNRTLSVLGNADQLQVMIVNLIRNAIRFSPEGHQVIVRVIDLETQCAVTVRDFGRGVPEEIINRLFDRFVQGPTESGRGHGLGLAIAQGIAELHGGQITVRNIAEAGCEFSVRLPLAPTPAV